MNLISIKKEIRLSAKEVEERNKRPKTEESEVIRNLLKVSKRILRTLAKVEYEPLLNTPGKVSLLLWDLICYCYIRIPLSEIKLFQI